MLQFVLAYGFLPTQPYHISFGTNRNIPFLATVTSDALIQERLEEARTTGSFDFDEFTTSKVAGVFAKCVGQTLGAGAKTFQVAMYEWTDSIANENVAKVPKAVYGYQYSQFTESSLYTLIPNSIVGYRGRVNGSFAVRPYQWGLFSNALAAAAGDDILLDRETWPDITDLSFISVHDLGFFLEEIGLQTESESQEIDSSLATVLLDGVLHFGTRRS